MSELYVIIDKILKLVGASADTWVFARDYLTIVSCSGPFVLIANCYSNMIRAKGESGKAMMGQLLGNLLNVILDPVFILVFGYVLINALQAYGAATEPLIVNISKQGLIYMPVMFLLGAVFSENGLVWAQPVADVLSLLLAAVLYVRLSKKWEKNEKI